MVKLIQIERLGPRIEAMLYRITFDETRALLDQGASKLIEAGQGLLHASHFKELLSVRVCSHLFDSGIHLYSIVDFTYW